MPLPYARSLVQFRFSSLSALLSLLSFATNTVSALPPPPGWTIVTSPNSSPTQHNAFFDLTCVSGSQCWAVGSYNNAGGFHQTLIAKWDGASWAIVPSPSTSATEDNLLSHVVCTSASQCWAVGLCHKAGFYQTLIEQWNGTSWTIALSPSTSVTEHNALYRVSCASASQCWAVGYYNRGGVRQTLIERWNGNSWAIVSSPNASASSDNTLNGVTCASASECWAVGDYSNTDGYKQTLIEQWNGTSWTIIPSTNTSATEHNQLNSVTCTSAAQCWAVGTFYLNSASPYQHTLIERWNGTSWTTISSANRSASDYEVLNVVTCVAASQCWAFGYSYYYDASSNENDQTLIEQWNGTSWTIVSSPNGPTRVNAFYGGTCVSASQCWAVGTVGDQTSQTLIEEFAPSPLGNISTRVKVGNGSNVLIGGFIINGIANKEVLVRGLGPTLSQFGLTGVLADPTLTLTTGSGTVIASNDNWKNTQQAAIMATGKAPPNDLESAILKTLSPGNYTAVLSGKDNTTGVGLMDVYDTDQSVSATLTNISSRGFVDVDTGVMIGGFIVRAGGSGAVKVIVRALGPTLTQFGVPDVLANPTLEVRDVNGALVASNDDWQDTQKSEIEASGFAPPNLAESAAIITQTAGNSTIVVRGKNNTTGNALVEVYQIP